jgi:hypothetical protein
MFSLSACGNTPVPEAADTSQPSQEAAETNEPTQEAPELSEPTQEATTDSEIPPEEFEDLLHIDPNNFDDPTNIDNEWWTLKPGTQYIFEGFDVVDGEKTFHRIIFTVTDLTKVINGVRTLVIFDRDYSEERLEESELTYFAQDNDGNVWHLGQYRETYDATEFVGGRIWAVGALEGAKAGIMMPADPQMGMPSYSEGYAPPPFNWTDRARVYQMGQKITTSLGSYEDVLVIEEYNQEEPGAFQLKYYARGVGNIRIGWRGDDTNQEEMELVEVVQLDSDALDKIRTEALELEKRAYIYAQTPPAEQIGADVSLLATSPLPGQPILTGQVTMCDLGASLINFRMIEPVPDLTQKTLTAQIADIETACFVNPTNPSLLTCKVPPQVTFPTKVTVNLDGAIVNDFSFEGIGCDEITTPVATPAP